MAWLQDIKHMIGALTEVMLMLLALAIVVTVFIGTNTAFFGNVVGNLMTIIKDLGANGLVGLIALGLILWLFSHRRLA
jgi:hypothetical protein